jgi:hypothetical protein
MPVGDRQQRRPVGDPGSEFVVDLATDRASDIEVLTNIGQAIVHPVRTYDHAVAAMSGFYEQPLGEQARIIGSGSVAMLLGGAIKVPLAEAPSVESLVRAVPSGAFIDAEVSALRRIAANNSVDTGSAARMTRIDELATANYNRILQNDLAGADYVYRAVSEKTLDIYRAQGSISGRGGSPTYFSLEGGASPLQQKLGAQLLDEPQVLLKIPVSELVNPAVPRPFGYGSVSPTIGREYFVNSSPQYGAVGFRQFVGTTSSYSDTWIVSPWGVR